MQLEGGLPATEAHVAMKHRVSDLEMPASHIGSKATRVPELDMLACPIDSATRVPTSGHVVAGGGVGLLV